VRAARPDGCKERTPLPHALTLLLVALTIPIMTMFPLVMLLELIRWRELAHRERLAVVRFRESYAVCVDLCAAHARKRMRDDRALADAAILAVLNQPAPRIPERASLIGNVNVGVSTK
jgi:hypothetical protein